MDVGAFSPVNRGKAMADRRGTYNEGVTSATDLYRRRIRATGRRLTSFRPPPISQTDLGGKRLLARFASI
jgi:hypothetical protein